MIRSATRVRRDAGFTFIEALIAVSLLSVVLVKLALVIRETQVTHSREVATMNLEDRARAVLDQISFAVIGADRQSIQPDPMAPGWTSMVDYRLSLGVEDGVTVWGDPESIRLSDEQRVVWLRNLGEPDERMVVWCSSVRPLHDGEIANGEDDNDNDLPDERGLSFNMEENMIVIRVTLEVSDGSDAPLTHTAETRVTCRN